MTYITVCKNTILSNRKNGTDKPALRISEGKYGKPRRAHSIRIKGMARVVQARPGEQGMPWGARAWVEVNN
jgi:hypothetical protein